MIDEERLFPLKPMVAFKADGVAHVLCANGAHFVWVDGVWEKASPLPGSASDHERRMEAMMAIQKAEMQQRLTEQRKAWRDALRKRGEDLA